MRRGLLRFRASGRASVGSSPKLRDEFSRILQVGPYLSRVDLVQQRPLQLRINGRGLPAPTPSSRPDQSNRIRDVLKNFGGPAPPDTPCTPHYFSFHRICSALAIRAVEQRQIVLRRIDGCTARQPKNSIADSVPTIKLSLYYST